MIGASHYRIGGDRLAAGAGRFAADVRAPGKLHAAVLRSRHAHSRLARVDARRAIELPGDDEPARPPGTGGSAATLGWAAPSPTPCATRSATAESASRSCRWLPRSCPPPSAARQPL